MTGLITRELEAASQKIGATGKACQGADAFCICG